MDSGSKANNGVQTDESLVLRSTLDGQDETKLSTRVLMALESVPDFDVEGSESVVFDHVDLDALDRLFDHVTAERRRGRVTFPLDQYEVTVTGTGEVTIRRASITPE